MSEIKKINIGGTEYSLPEGGVSSVFEDVAALPENPDPQKIYRVNTPEIYIYEGATLYTLKEALDIKIGSSTIHNIIPVNELPQEPIVFADESTLTFTIYVMNNSIYGWFTTDGTNYSWMSDSTLTGLFEMAYGGLVGSLDVSSMTSGNAYLYYNIEYINIMSGKKFRLDSEKTIITLTEDPFVLNEEQIQLIKEDKAILRMGGAGFYIEYVRNISIENDNTSGAVYCSFLDLFSLSMSQLTVDFNTGQITESSTTILDSSVNMSANGLTITLDNGDAWFRRIDLTSAVTDKVNDIITNKTASTIDTSTNLVTASAVKSYIDPSNYYTKTEANDSTNNSIDAAKLGGVSASSYIRDNSPSLETPVTFLNGVIIGTAGGLTVQGKLYTRESTNATTYGPGQNGQVLMSNGVSPYWGNVSFASGEVESLDIKSEGATVKGGTISGGNGNLVIEAQGTGYSSILDLSADVVNVNTTNNQLQIKDNNNNIGLQFDESGLTVDSIRANQIFSPELEDIKQTTSNLQTQIDSINNQPMITGSDNITNIQVISQANYNALTTKSNTTLYIIVG